MDLNEIYEATYIIDLHGGILVELAEKIDAAATRMAAEIERLKAASCKECKHRKLGGLFGPLDKCGRHDFRFDPTQAHEILKCNEWEAPDGK